MTSKEQTTFVSEYFGSLFEKNNIKTKMIIYDHNCDHPDFPIEILNNPKAKKQIDGSAFHLYAGDIYVLQKIHDSHPNKNVYFTEQWKCSKGDFGTDLK